MRNNYRAWRKLQRALVLGSKSGNLRGSYWDRLYNFKVSANG